MAAQRLSLEQQAERLLNRGSAAPAKARDGADALPPRPAPTGRTKISLEEQAARLSQPGLAPAGEGEAGADSGRRRRTSRRWGLRLLALGMLIALGGLLALVSIATVPALFGYHTYTVYGDSTAPGLDLGSVAIAKPTSPEDLEVGDIVARRSLDGGSTVLHRIDEIVLVDGERRFVTRGGKESAFDPEPVAFAGSGDRVVYTVPYAGYFLHYTGDGWTRVLLIMVPLALAGLVLTRERWRRARHEAGAQPGEADWERPEGW